MVRLVGLDTNRLAQVADETVNLRKGLTGDVGRLRFRRRGGLVKRPEVEQRDLGGFGKQGQPELLGVAAGNAGAALIHPAARVAARLQILKIPEGGPAVALLQVLIAVDRVAGLRASVDLFEVLRLGFQVETQVSEV